MADDQIIAREHIRAKARRAFSRGDTRDSHGFNPGSAAILDWIEEYDRCSAVFSHDATCAPKCIDFAQAGV